MRDGTSENWKKVSSVFYGGIFFFFCWWDNNWCNWHFGHIFQFLFRDIVSWEACIKMLRWWTNDKIKKWFEKKATSQWAVTQRSSPLRQPEVQISRWFSIFQLSISFNNPRMSTMSLSHQQKKKKKSFRKLYSAFQFSVLPSLSGNCWTYAKSLSSAADTVKCSSASQRKHQTTRHKSTWSMKWLSRWWILLKQIKS